MGWMVTEAGVIRKAHPVTPGAAGTLSLGYLVWGGEVGWG